MRTIEGYQCDQFVKRIYAPSIGKSVTQQTILIPGGGCAYYRAKKGNACTFCAFPGATRDLIKGPGYENFYGSWGLSFEIYKSMFDQLINKDVEIDRMAIFNGGSFFPSSELPDKFQNYIYEEAANHPFLQELFVESYPNFILESKLENALSILDGKSLIIGIGLESSNDIVRNSFLNKGIEIALFEKKIKIMKDLGVKSSIYVFLKPHQLSERQAYDDVVNTLSYLSSLGVDEIAISCAFVSPGTILENLYDNGDFRPPWLWTILKIIKKAKANDWPINIGGFEDTPPPKAIPSNCASCDSIVLDMIEGYRKKRDIDFKFLPICSCFKGWEEVMGRGYGK